MSTAEASPITSKEPSGPPFEELLSLNSKPVNPVGFAPGEHDAQPRVLPRDPLKAVVSLIALSTTTGLSVDDLYNRARARGLLIDAPYRTPAADREVYRDQIDEVLAPKRGFKQDKSGEPVGPLKTPSAVAKSAPDLRVSACLKLIKLTKKGHFTADEALILIEATLNA